MKEAREEKGWTQAYVAELVDRGNIRCLSQAKKYKEEIQEQCQIRFE